MPQEWTLFECVLFKVVTSEGLDDIGITLSPTQQMVVCQAMLDAMNTAIDAFRESGVEVQ